MEVADDLEFVEPCGGAQVRTGVECVFNAGNGVSDGDFEPLWDTLQGRTRSQLEGGVEFVLLRLGNGLG